MNEYTPQGRNTCGISSPRGDKKHSVECVKWYGHLPHGPCQNTSTNRQWCFIDDSFDCSHMKKWRRSKTWDISDVLD